MVHSVCALTIESGMNLHLGLPTLDLGIPGLPRFSFPPLPLFPLPPSFPFPGGPPLNQLGSLRERCKLPVTSEAPADKWFGAYLSQKEQLWWQQFLWIFIRVNLNFCTNTRLLSSRYSVTNKHNTRYNTLISEQPYIHARWSIFTFPGQNEPRPGHGLFIFVLTCHKQTKSVSGPMWTRYRHRVIDLM